MRPSTSSAVYTSSSLIHNKKQIDLYNESTQSFVAKKHNRKKKIGYQNWKYPLVYTHLANRKQKYMNNKLT